VPCPPGSAAADLDPILYCTIIYKWISASINVRAERQTEGGSHAIQRPRFHQTAIVAACGIDRVTMQHDYRMEIAAFLRGDRGQVVCGRDPKRLAISAPKCVVHERCDEPILSNP
jgi:hypothetical protein